MEFYLHPHRKTVLAHFLDVSSRDKALEELDKKFVRVKFQKLNESDILINKTGSMVFDIHVEKEVESLGGFFE